MLSHHFGILDNDPKGLTGTKFYAEFSYTDKKVRDGKLRFVFQKGIGDVMQFEDGRYAKPIAEEEIREILMNM